MAGKRASKNFPKALKPMLATLVDKPFNNDDWLFEIKWDGYRALAFMNGSYRSLKSRNDKSFDEKFYPVFAAIKKWNVNAIVDGEIVMVGKNGLPSFGGLQNWRAEADGRLTYNVFDLLWLNGKDLTGLPLLKRRAQLQSILPKKDDIIRFSDAVEGQGVDLFNEARKMGLEGIMAKRKDSTYAVNDRSTEWLKIKSNKRQEMVIGGFTINNDTHKPFSALLVGVYYKGRLHYTGKVGTGFNLKTQQEMMKLFKPLITTKVPFTKVPDINKPSGFRPNPPKAKAYFLKPQLVCEVSYAELTADGVMRHPAFQGMRTDKKATAVVLEQEKQVTGAVKTKSKITTKPIAKTRKGRGGTTK